MSVATKTKALHDRQRSVAVEAAAPLAVDSPDRAFAPVIDRPSSASGADAASLRATAALASWLNAEARQHLRPGCRVGVVGSDAAILARELTKRGYDAAAVDSAQSQASLRSRCDFVVAYASAPESLGQTLRVAAALPRAHGGVVVLSAAGSAPSPDAVGAVLASQGFAPAPMKAPASVSMCWRRQG